VDYGESGSPVVFDSKYPDYSSFDDSVTVDEVDAAMVLAAVVMQ
jgi:hypothetical protein